MDTCCRQRYIVQENTHIGKSKCRLIMGKIFTSMISILITIGHSPNFLTIFTLQDYKFMDCCFISAFTRSLNALTWETTLRLMARAFQKEIDLWRKLRSYFLFYNTESIYKMTIIQPWQWQKINLYIWKCKIFLNTFRLVQKW